MAFGNLGVEVTLLNSKVLKITLLNPKVLTFVRAIFAQNDPLTQGDYWKRWRPWSILLKDIHTEDHLWICVTSLSLPQRVWQRPTHRGPWLHGQVLELLRPRHRDAPQAAQTLIEVVAVLPRGPQPRVLQRLSGKQRSEGREAFSRQKDIKRRPRRGVGREKLAAKKNQQKESQEKKSQKKLNDLKRPITPKIHLEGVRRMHATTGMLVQVPGFESRNREKHLKKERVWLL